MKFQIMFSPFIFALLACSAQNGGSDAVARLERKLNDLRSFQAEQTADLNSLQEELRNLTGRVDQFEFQMKSTRPSDLADNQVVAPLKNTMQHAPEPVIPGITTTLTPPPIVPLTELEVDESLASHLDVSLAQLFQDSLYFIRQGQYRQALPLLDQVISYGDGKEGQMQAFFWKGICFEGMGNNRDALAAFNAVVQRFPQKDRSRLSLLRLASVFVRLGDTATARLTLQKLIADAPNSKEADRAREKLKDL